MFSAHIIHLSLASRRRAFVFAMGFILPSLFLAGEDMRVGAAGILADSLRLSPLRMAVRIDPRSAENHRKLGLYYLHSMEDLNAQGAAEEFRRGTELSPESAVDWSALAEACASAGNNDCAEQALGRALRLSPMTPHLHWDAALYFVMAGHPSSALPHLRRLLELDGTYAAAAFRLYPESTVPDVVLREMLPAVKSPGLDMQYIDYLSSQGKDELAFRVWKETMTNTGSYHYSSAAPYLERLLRHGQTAEAQSVWGDLVRLGVVPKAGASNSHNLMFNGGFEAVPLNGGFDWRVQNTPYLFVDPQNPNAHGGRYCLRLDFTVPRNDEVTPVFQYVPVEPKRTYRLTAYARSESLSSDSGPRLRAVDPSCLACLDVSSQQTLGTTPWHKIDLTFSTPPDTRLLILYVSRPRSRSFPTEITGTFWLDDLSLEESTHFSKEVLVAQGK